MKFNTVMLYVRNKRKRDSSRISLNRSKPIIKGNLFLSTEGTVLVQNDPTQVYSSTFFVDNISCLNSKGYTIATRITVITIRLIKCVPYYINIKMHTDKMQEKTK